MGHPQGDYYHLVYLVLCDGTKLLSKPKAISSSFELRVDSVLLDDLDSFINELDNLPRSIGSRNDH